MNHILRLVIKNTFLLIEPRQRVISLIPEPIFLSYLSTYSLQEIVTEIKNQSDVMLNKIHSICTEKIKSELDYED